MTMPLVSVVIPSHRQCFLRDLLSALSKQTLEQPLFEVIAACDYPIDTLCKEFPAVVFLRINDLSISRKRNAAVAVAKSDLLAFIDDDCIPTPGWLAAGIASFSDHATVAAVEGQTLIEPADIPVPALREYRRLETFGFRTNNLFCRKAAFFEAGGFDERFTVQREDLDFSFTLLEKGYVIHRSPDITVTHRVRRGEPWDLLKNCVNRRFDPLLFKKHPARYRAHVGSPFPPTLLLLFALHLIVGGCATLGPTVCAVAGITDCLAVTLVTARRCTWRTSFTIFMTEWTAVLAAPLVLLGALIAGSIRFRRLLIL